MNLQKNPYFIHQWIWIVVALAINIYSYVRIESGTSGLTKTSPEGGILIFLVYVPFLVLGQLGWRRTYLAGTAAFVVLIAFGGILRHLATALEPGGLDAYASTLWWAIAIVVNCYGVSMSGMAMLRMQR
ncbi:MAG: hypothetical protein Hals2KO_39290 [Halioglobus sp.]